MRHIVAGDEAGDTAGIVTAPADGRHVEGPCEPAAVQQMEDGYGFSMEVTAEQAAILERCRAKQEHARERWAAAPREEHSGLPPPDVLKKLCRKVGGVGRGATLVIEESGGLLLFAHDSTAAAARQQGQRRRTGQATAHPSPCACLSGRAARHAAAGVAGAVGCQGAPRARAAALLRLGGAAGP